MFSHIYISKFYYITILLYRQRNKVTKIHAIFFSPCTVVGGQNLAITGIGSLDCYSTVIVDYSGN